MVCTFLRRVQHLFFQSVTSVANFPKLDQCFDATFLSTCTPPPVPAAHRSDNISPAACPTTILQTSITCSSHISPSTRPVVTLSATPPLLASSLLHIVLFLFSRAHPFNLLSLLHSIPHFFLQTVRFFFCDLMSIVLSLLFTCWLHLLPAVHSLPCLRSLRSCWGLPTTYPGKACDTLQFHCFFFAAPFPTTHTEHYCFSGVTCRILFPLPCSPLCSPNRMLWH